MTRFHSTRYQAQPWAHPRRVGITVEVSNQGVNTRCVVTDMEQARTKVLDQKIYCARGQAENEIKDHKTISLPSSCPVAPVLRRSLTLLACVRLPEPAR
jgi:hypothetical protein